MATTAAARRRAAERAAAGTVVHQHFAADTSSSSVASVALVGVVIVAVLAATVALAWHGTINGEASSGIIFAILAGVLGAGAHAAGTRAGSQASVNPPPDA